MGSNAPLVELVETDKKCKLAETGTPFDGLRDRNIQTQGINSPLVELVETDKKRELAEIGTPFVGLRDLKLCSLSINVRLNDQPTKQVQHDDRSSTT